MKKLLFAIVVAGLWFASSFSINNQSQEREIEMKAMRAIDTEVGKYKSSTLQRHYTNEYRIMNKDQNTALTKLTREFTRLAPAAVHIDPKNGPRVIELSNSVTRAQDALSEATNELYQYLTVKSAATINQDKIN